MHNGLKYFLVFALGAAAGSVATWKIVKTKYERIAQEEIESVKEVFSRLSKTDDKEESEEEVEEAISEAEVVEYKTILSDYQTDTEKGGSESMKLPRPRVIAPEEYGDNENYENISLTYYAGDDVLADELNEPVEDVENTVGLDFDTHFGEYEDDSVFIVNDRLKCYYEILMDYRNHKDVMTAMDIMMTTEDDLNPYEDDE